MSDFAHPATPASPAHGPQAADLPHDRDEAIVGANGLVERLKISLPLFEDAPPEGGLEYGRVSVVVRCIVPLPLDDIALGDSSVPLTRASVSGLEFSRRAQLGARAPRNDSMPPSAWRTRHATPAGTARVEMARVGALRIVVFRSERRIEPSHCRTSAAVKLYLADPQDPDDPDDPVDHPVDHPAAGPADIAEPGVPTERLLAHIDYTDLAKENQELLVYAPGPGGVRGPHLFTIILGVQGPRAPPSGRVFFEDWLPDRNLLWSLASAVANFFSDFQRSVRQRVG
jgi:hypothetical protein